MPKGMPNKIHKNLPVPIRATVIIDIAHSPINARSVKVGAVKSPTRGPANRTAITTIATITTGQGVSINNTSMPSSVQRILAVIPSNTPLKRTASEPRPLSPCCVRIEKCSLPTGNSPIGIVVSKKCPLRFDHTFFPCATENRNRVSGQIQSITKTPQNTLYQITSGRTLEFERHAKYCRSSAILAQTSLNLSIIYQNCRPQKPYFEPHFLSQNYLSDGSKSRSGGRDREPVSCPRSRSIVDREKPSRLTNSSCFICELSKTRRAIFFQATTAVQLECLQVRP